jgi:hypothetical protein
MQIMRYPGYVEIIESVNDQPIARIQSWSLVTIQGADGKQTKHVMGRV